MELLSTTSLLHQTLDPDLPAEDIYESDLDPARTRWGRYEGEPCIFFAYSAKDGLNPLSGDSIRSCGDADDFARNETLELLEVDCAWVCSLTSTPACTCRTPFRSSFSVLYATGGNARWDSPSAAATITTST